MTLSDFDSGNTGDVLSKEMTVDLMKGYNVIRMGSRYTWTPDIDRFVLEFYNK